MTSPFEECYLLPKTFLIKKRNKEKTPASILSNKKLPSDLRLKYFDNFMKFDKGKPSVRALTQDEPEINIDTLLGDLPLMNVPEARALLQFMKDSHEISWNLNLELIIDNTTINRSDLRKIIRYMLGLSTVTRHTDIPIGAEQLISKLELLDFPFEWLRKFPRQKLDRAAKIKVSKEEEELLEGVSKKKAPEAKALLQFMKDSAEISWNSNLELVLDNTPIFGSDLREIIRYMLGLTAKHIPTGAEQLISKLKELDFPFEQLKKSSKQVTKKQVGKGWIVF